MATIIATVNIHLFIKQALLRRFRAGARFANCYELALSDSLTVRTSIIAVIQEIHEVHKQQPIRQTISWALALSVFPAQKLWTPQWPKKIASKR